MALSDTLIRNTKPKDKAFKLYDEKGLFIQVMPNGGKWWRFKYRFNDKEKLLSLGTYPEVMLSQARTKRDEARALVADNIDPSNDRKAQDQKQKLEANNTFEAVANEWHSLHNKNKSATHQQRVSRWLSYYLYPSLGNKPISTITAPMVLETTKLLQNQGKLETAHRVIQTAGQVFRYAIQKGFANYNPTPDLKGALPPPVVKHMAAMIEPKDVAQLLRSIDAYQGSLTVQCALKLAPLLCQTAFKTFHLSASNSFHFFALLSTVFAMLKSVRIIPSF